MMRDFDGPNGRGAMLLVMAIGALALAVPAAGAQAARAEEIVRVLPTGTPIEGTSSTLVRTGTGISATLKTSLPPGMAVTLWWVFINEPAGCTAEPFPLEGSQCGINDVLAGRTPGNPAAASVQYATGHVIGSEGTANFGMYASSGDQPNCPSAFHCAGLTDPLGAEVWVVARTHGEADPALMPAQISSFEETCGSRCKNVQYAAYQAT